MAFLTKDELNTVGDLNLIDLLTDLNDDIVTDIIDESIDFMKGYLSRFYDVDTIFNATGDARKKSIVKRLKDIVIFGIFDRQKREPGTAVLRGYNEAVGWLEKSYTGELGDRTLPPKVVEPEESEGTAGDLRFGGDVQYQSNF